MTRFLCPCGPEKPNHDGFLRPRRERPCDCGAGNTFDEVAPPHCLPPRLRTNHRTAVTHSLEGVSGGSGFPLGSNADIRIRTRWTATLVAPRRSTYRPPGNQPIQKT